MPTHYRFEPDRLAPAPPLGAVELMSYPATPANDNGHDSAAAPMAGPRWIGFMLPAVTFATGLTAALLVAGLGRALGVTG